jgi:hypothetical protein
LKEKAAEYEKKKATAAAKVRAATPNAVAG